LLANSYFLVFAEFLYLLYVSLLCSAASVAISDPRDRDGKKIGY